MKPKKQSRVAALQKGAVTRSFLHTNVNPNASAPPKFQHLKSR